MALTKGLTGRAVADAVGVTEANVSKWRNGKVPKYLHAPTRDRISAILAQPGWKYVASTPPTAEEERAAAQHAAYAAGVLWSIASDAEHIARKAREAHARITGDTPLSANQAERGALKSPTEPTPAPRRRRKRA